MVNRIAALYTNDNFIYKVNICLFLKFYQSMLYLNQNFSIISKILLSLSCQNRYNFL